MSDTPADSNSCPRCGAVLPSSPTAGLCPRCLLAEAMSPTQGGVEPAAARKTLTPEELAPFFPQLEIFECLGRGGMGVVYKARQKTLNRLVALKLLAPERAHDAQFAERFTREAQALAALSHPNIVTIHDFGQAGGFYYLLMEFVDGANLRQLLHARKFTPEEALAIVPPLCDALQLAHDRGIVHRDIKPENLLLDKEGRVKVADFGIAKMMRAVDTGGQGGEISARENATQTAVGTPAYSAPEQKTDPQRVDSRADIYSLGVVFYEMLTGELPGKRIEPPSRKVQIDVRLDEVVLRALEREPERRYQTASELKTVIETVVAETMKFGGAGSFAPGTGPAGVPAKTTALPAARWSRTAIAGAVGIGLFVVVMILWLVDWPASRDPNFGHTLPQILFQSIALPAGLLALLAGTILGWTAVVKIRCSAGQLRGLRLAAFEGLFVPVLTVDFLILIMWAIAVKALAVRRGLDGSMFRNLWDFAAFTLLLGVVTGWVNYLIIKPVWSAISRISGGGAPGSNTHTRRSLRRLAVALGLAITILYPGYVLLTENSHKARYGWVVEAGTELNYQIFEADASLVDKLVPFDVREPGNAVSSGGNYVLAPACTATAQMAEIDSDVLNALRQSAATRSSLLVNATREGEGIYQWSSDTWSYNTDQASGQGQGFCGMGRDRQSLRFRIRYQVTHIVVGNARHPITAEISYDGPTPRSGKVRAFFIPFGRDQQAKYLVLTFVTKAVSPGKAPDMPTAEQTTLGSAPVGPADSRLVSRVKNGSEQAVVPETSAHPEWLNIRPLEAWIDDTQSSDPKIKELAELALTQMGTNTLPGIIKILNESTESTQEAAVNAAEAVKYMGPDVVSALPAFEALLRSGQQERAYSGARALAFSAPIVPEAFSILTNALADPAVGVRDAANNGIGFCFSFCPNDYALTALPLVVHNLKDPVDYVRSDAAAALMMFTQRQCQLNRPEPDFLLPPLLEALHDKYSYTRAHAVGALSCSCFHDQLQPSLLEIQKLRDDPDETVRRFATNLVQMLAPAPAGPAAARLESKVKYASEQASVQDIVQSLAEQVGLKYDWQKSHDQTDPLCRQWVRNVAIDGQTCNEALEQVLKPVGLHYQVDDGVLVLSRQDGGIASHPPSTGLVELKEKWLPGQRYVKNVELKQNTALFLQGRAGTVNQDITIGTRYGLTVLRETPDGGHELQLEFLNARMRIKMGDDTLLDYDSTNQSAGDQTNGVAAVFQKIVGSKLRYSLNADNAAERLEGVGELVRRIQSVPQTGVFTGDIKDIFGAAYFQQLTNANPFLPPQTVQPGDTWTSHFEYSIASVGIEAWDHKVVFQKWEMHENRRCARLEFQGIVNVKPDPNSKRDEKTYHPRDGAAEGTLWFDPELGQTLEVDLKIDVNIDKKTPTNVSGTPGVAGTMQTITTQRHQLITIKLER